MFSYPRKPLVITKLEGAVSSSSSSSSSASTSPSSASVTPALFMRGTNLTSTHAVNYSTSVTANASGGVTHDYASGASIPLYAASVTNTDTSVLTHFKSSASDTYWFPQVLVDGSYDVHAMFRLSGVKSPSNFNIHENLVRAGVSNPFHPVVAFQNKNAVDGGEMLVDYRFIYDLQAGDGLEFNLVTYNTTYLNIDEVRYIVKKL